MTGVRPDCRAQSYDEEDIENFSDSVLLTKEMSGGFILHSMGWGIEFRKGKNLSARKMLQMEFDFTEMKSPKEIRVINPYFTNAKSYIYGKLNNVFLIRGGFGLHNLLNSKPYWGGVELRYFFSGGASLGLAKPVYLNIINLVSISQYYFEYELSTEKYDPDKHFRDNIYGRAAFLKGFNQMAFYPGIYGKFGFTFDFGPYDAIVKKLEAGVTIDFFPIPIPMMAYNDPEYYFLTIYLGINFGKRFNR
ncbi:MAG: hypothetical protein NT175_04535 [Bacteroidetes bacterium]|nr:hypothetical protein [Bacteroidota bacterium]